MRYFLVPAAFGIVVLAGPAFAQPAPALPEDSARALVDSWYQKFLNRQPDSWSSAFVTALEGGSQTPEQVLSTILGSPEYYDKGGDTPEGFAQTIFLDLAGRPPTPREIHYWSQQLLQSSRNDVAYQLLTRYPQAWQGISPGYYGPRDPGYTPAPVYEYRRPSFPYRRPDYYERHRDYDDHRRDYHERRRDYDRRDYDDRR
jgi:hypothetical protein